MWRVQWQYNETLRSTRVAAYRCLIKRKRGSVEQLVIQLQLLEAYLVALVCPLFNIQRFGYFLFETVGGWLEIQTNIPFFVDKALKFLRMMIKYENIRLIES